MADRPHPNGDSKTPMEAVVARLLFDRLNAEDWLIQGDREAVSYRIAEIMVAAKELYTITLPRLLGQQVEGKLSLYDEVAGFRMAVLHIRDLVGDFDAAFLDAMTHERDVDPERPTWDNPDDWEGEEIEEE